MASFRKLIISGSNAELNSLTVSGTISGSIHSGSHVGDGSGLTGVTSSPAGPDQSIQFRDGGLTSGSSDLLFDKVNRILKLSGATTVNAITSSGTIDNYLQVNIQNKSNGTTGSSDIVATNDTGTEIGNYIDMGINSSGYNQPNLLGGANDGYLYNTGSKLIIGNVTPSVHPSSSIYFVVGGPNQGLNTKMQISSSGQVSASSYVGNGQGLTGINKNFGITIDGGGSAITTGIKGDVTLPFSGTIIGWYITADQAGSIVIDIWKDIFANFPPTAADSIAGTEKPTLSGTAANSDTNLTTWSSVTISSGDVIRFNVDSVATVTRVTLVIQART